MSAPVGSRPTAPGGRIRPVALAVVRRPHTGELLVFEGRDESRGLTYHRPPGGGIRFGETARETVVRELREEFGVVVVPQRLLGVTETIFTAFERLRHEIVFLVACSFADARLCERPMFADPEEGGEHGLWLNPEDRRIPLFPEDLRSMLDDRA